MAEETKKVATKATSEKSAAAKKPAAEKPAAAKAPAKKTAAEKPAAEKKAPAKKEDEVACAIPLSSDALASVQCQPSTTLPEIVTQRKSYPTAP